VSAYFSWFIEKLHDWQDFAGAIIGGGLGVIGALIVAQGVSDRELRTASRMLQRDLLNVRGMVYSLTYHRKVTLDALDPKLLASNLVFYRYRLSPLFEGQMAIVTGVDRMAADMLIGFHQSYAGFENHMQKIERPDEPISHRAFDAMPGALAMADDYAEAAIYLCQLHEMKLTRRAWERFRRQFFRDQHDKDSAALIERLVNAEHPSCDLKHRPKKVGASKG
jgi:hypothetical protein